MFRAVLLTPSDAEAYVMLRAEMLADSPWSFASSPGHDKGADVAGMRASLALPGFAVVAVRDPEAPERLLAAAGIIREDQPKRHHLALIWGVYVTPAARRRGLGKAVVEAAVETARGWPGVAGVNLALNQTSPGAKALYESLGFVAWGVEPDALRINGETSTETHLHRRL